jgi:hypothetical protein
MPANLATGAVGTSESRSIGRKVVLFRRKEGKWN